MSQKKNVPLANFTRFGKLLLFFAVLILIPILANQQIPMNNVRAHSNYAWPKEIFSLWNDTAPILDGEVNFHPHLVSEEWSSASINLMFNSSYNVGGVLYLQNDDTDLYIGMDLMMQQEEFPGTTWGCGVYLDTRHDGYLLDPYSDRAVFLLHDGSVITVYLCGYDPEAEAWLIQETGTAGEMLPSGVICNTAFTDSVFEKTPHRQFELKIPFDIIGRGPGGILGVAFEAFEDFFGNIDSITWPFIGFFPGRIRFESWHWGDLYLGEGSSADNNVYSRYIIEENTRIKYDAFGSNNGTFFATGDIDGNGDLELIVSSNRTAATSEGIQPLLAVFDYEDGYYQRIWASWFSGLPQLPFFIRGIIAHDFDGDGKDEIYVCGQNRRILRIHDWNTSLGDFQQAENAFINSHGLMGYIAVGDPDNDGLMELVAGGQNGFVLILKYEPAFDTFTHDENSPLTPPQVDASRPYRIHAVDIADMDDDGKEELLLFSQPYDDDDESITRLQILEKGDGVVIPSTNYVDNPEDDLPSSSYHTTEDRLGHTIVVEDVDNDGEMETIVVGRKYLRIFEKDGFTDQSNIIEFNLNLCDDFPYMAGGATVADIDDDTNNELIFGCNNGTVVVMEVVDSSGNEPIIEWMGDIGASPGKREALVVLDHDGDGEKELILGDNFGQILIIGSSYAPFLSIISPTPGSSTGNDLVFVEWEVFEDFFSMHHYDIRLNGDFAGRAGGAQTGFILQLEDGDNIIEVEGYDINGKMGYDITNVFFEQGLPEVKIIAPDNNYETGEDEVTVVYEGYDSSGLIDHYEIWRNDTLVESYTTETVYDVSLPDDGVWNITVVAVNTLDKKASDRVYVIRDTENPDISITSPNNNAATKGVEIELKWTASDRLSGIDYFEISRDGYYYGSTTERSFVVGLDLDKEYLLEVEAFDEVGNSEIAQVSVTRDTVSPIVTVLSPGDEYITRSSSLFLSWNTTDNTGGTGIDFTKVEVNGDVEYQGSELNVTIDLGSEEGEKLILVTSYDEAGNFATDYITVIVDNTNPYINILSPENNFTTGLPYIIISWESSDGGTGIKEYQVLVDGLPRSIISDPEKTYYQASIPDEKTYIITVKSIDFLDNEAEDAIEVTHDPSTATLAITKPTEMYLYSGSAEVNVSWAVNNIENLDRFELYLNGTLENTFNDTQITSAVINFATYANATSPTNLTVIAIANGAFYKDFRWITIDLSLPEVSINSPEENTLLLEDELNVEWYGEDDGSGILEYRIKLNGETVATVNAEKTSKVVSFEGQEGHIFILLIEAVDRAGNVANDSVSLRVYLDPPTFVIVGIEEPYATKTGQFQFNVSVTDTGLGVRKLEVYADGKNILSENYEENLKTQPFSVLVDVIEFENVTGTSWHNLTVVVTDISNREGIGLIAIYVDHLPPSFVNTIVDTQLLTSSTVTQIEISEDSPTLHNVTVFATDNSNIQGVALTILGEGVNETYELGFYMRLGQNFENATYEYRLTLDLEGFELGEYTFIFTIQDIAGNSYSQSYDVEIIEIQKLPWIFEGNNLIYVSAGGALVAALVIVLAVTLRKPIANRGWRESVLAVAYVMKSGTTCVYVPYSPDLFSDDQLFGGAMTGIRGVLAEITGKKALPKVESVEFGDTTLLIYPGAYGEAILMVTKVKPILKERLQKFTRDFELEFKKELLNQVVVDLDVFSISTVIVESYFGVRKYLSPDFAPTEQVFDEATLETIPRPPTEAEVSDFTSPPPPSPTMPFEAGIRTEEQGLSNEMKALVTQMIQAVQKALTLTIEGDFDNADGQAQFILNSMEIILQSGEPITEIQVILETLPKIIEEIFKGIQFGRAGNKQELINAVERASNLFEKLL